MVSRMNRALDIDAVPDNESDQRDTKSVGNDRKIIPFFNDIDRFFLGCEIIIHKRFVPFLKPRGSSFWNKNRMFSLRSNYGCPVPVFRP